MPVLFDTNILLLLLQPDAKPPLDPQTGLPLEHAADRIDYLVRSLTKRRVEVLIPAPVLTEVLCNAKAATTQYIEQLQLSPFRIAAFDTRAAIECSQLLVHHHRTKKITKGQTALGGRGKINLDRQIVAISVVNRVELIYSDDEDVFKEAGRVGIKVSRSVDLVRNPGNLQSRLDFSEQGLP